MKRKKVIWILLLTMFFSLVVCGGSVVAADPNEESQGHSMLFDILTNFPDERIEEAKAEGYNPRFARYEPSRYTLEGFVAEQSSFDILATAENAGYGLLHEINNMLWQLLLTWDFNVIMLVETSYSLDIVDAFADVVEGSIQQLAGFADGGIGSSGLWGNFLIFVLVMAGAWIAYKGMVQKSTTSAWQAMISTLIILMVSLLFFANAGGIMRYINSISSGISQEIMGVANNLTGSKTDTDGDIASVVAADQLYEMLIYEPYLILQYGSTSSNPELTDARIQKILGNKVGSEARGKAVQEEVEANNPMMESSSVFQRLGFVLLLIVLHLVLGIVFIVIAGAMLLYQILFVIFALFAPFAFLLALYPAWSYVAMEWVKKFIGYALVKIVIGLFLSLILAISQFLYIMAPPKSGYLLTMILQAVLILGVLWKRNDLIGLLHTVQTGEANVQNIANTLKKYLDKATGNLNKLGRMQK